MLNCVALRQRLLSCCTTTVRTLLSQQGHQSQQPTVCWEFQVDFLLQVAGDDVLAHGTFFWDLGGPQVSRMLQHVQSTAAPASV